MNEPLWSKELGWISCWRSAKQLEFFHPNPRETLLQCDRVPCRVAVSEGESLNRIFFPKETKGWRLNFHESVMAGHEFVIRNLFPNGKRLIGSVALAHRSTGLIVSKVSPDSSTLLKLFSILTRRSKQLELSLSDFCLLRFLERLQRLKARTLRATSKEAVDSLNRLGLDPQQTVAQWMGLEAYTRAASAQVKIALSK